MEWTRMEQTTAPQLCALLDGDRYTFAVMRNILGGMFGDAGKIVTDGSAVLLCYTCPPFPGWVWTKQAAPQEELARAWAVIRQELPPEAGYRINMRPEMAAYIMSTPEGGALRVDTRLNAYGCETLVPPTRAAQGDTYAVAMDALDLAAGWSQALSEEENLDLRPMEAHRREMAEFIDRKRLFMWKNPEGEPVAMCTVSENDDLAYVGNVYTAPAHRRHGYAANLVYRVTRILLRQGKRPALYVNAENAPAAACYEKLGYVQQGSIVTVGQS